MIRTLQSSWMVTLIGGLLYLATTVALFNPGPFVSLPVAAKEPPSSGDAPSWKFRNPEFDQWIAEIKQEKDALALREQQLNELQTRLEAERSEISLVTESVRQVQEEFDKNVVRIKAQEADNLKRQAKVIAGMTPEGAAALLSEMEDDDVVRVLFNMKSDEASQILDIMSKSGKDGVTRAASITERLRRVLPPSTSARPTSAL